MRRVTQDFNNYRASAEVSTPLFIVISFLEIVSRPEESYRHQYMQDACESDNCLVLSRLNAQTPPSIARVCLITA